MKKIYEKPEMYMESFEISEFIATNCGTDVGFSADNCTIDMSDYFGLGAGSVMVYSNSNSDCNTTPSGDNDKVCYHNPEDDTRVFGS